MFKRKFLAAALSTAMVAGMLTGCGGAATDTSSNEDVTEAVTEAAADDTAAEDTASDDTAAEDTAAEDTAEDAGGKKVGIAMPTKSLERWNRDGSYLQE
jgi:putative multiple sugar transport system substrate-binding protein